MNKEISIIGGDLRIAELAKIMASEGTKVYTYGLEKANLTDENIISCKSLEELAKKDSKLIIGPVPFSKNQNTISAPFALAEIYIENFIKVVKSGSIFISGKLDSVINDMFKRINVTAIDVMQREEFTILNAVATAEGAIELAMQKTPITLHEANVLVLGFGRIGKILSKMLDGIGANVFCEARKNSDIAWIRAYGYEPIHLDNLNNNLEKFDIVFNTIPSMIIDEERLRLLKKDCIILDVSSMPGGVDFERAEDLGIKASLELGLPGKVAPKTAAKYIKDTLDNIIREINI